jgi:hypothetical protein
MKMENTLKIELGSLAGKYSPTAVYFYDSDCVEYVTEDTLCVYDRIDDFLTLITDENQRNVLGFKLKGFSKSAKLVIGENGNEEQFLQLLTVIEAVCKEIGAALFEDDDRNRAYATVKKIAANDNLVLDRSTFSSWLMAA